MLAAAIRSYIFPQWQLPLLLAVVLVWVFVGGRMLLARVNKTELAKRPKRGRCLVIMLCAGLAAGAVGGALMGLFATIASATDAGLALYVVGLVVSLAGMFFASQLVIYAMMDVTLAKAVRLGALPVGVMMVLLAGVASGAGALAWRQHLANVDKAKCAFNLTNNIGPAINNYYRKNLQMPDSLEVLVGSQLDAASLKCPSLPDRAVGYAYLKPPPPAERDGLRIMVCDLAGAHSGGRNVLLSDGSGRWYSTDEFDALLAQSQNQAFAQLLKSLEN